MGTISDKLQYLDNTRELLKDTINLTNANILSTDTFRSYANSLKNGLVDIINNGIDTLYDNFPKVSGEGTEIVLNNTYEAPIKLNVVKGDTQQDSYSGKNLCSNATNFSGGAIYLYFDPTKINKTITVSLISDVSVEGALFSLFGGTTSLGNIEQTIDLIANEKVTKTFTLSDEKYEQLQNYSICNFSIYKSGAGHDTTKVPGEAQIENNSSYTGYEPYVGGMASPNPDYPQDIKVVTGNQVVSVSDGTNTTTYNVNLGNIELCKINNYEDFINKSTGKNLFDSSTLNANKGITSDGSLENNTALSTSDYIIVKPSTDYYLSNVVGNIGRSCAYYDNNKAFISAEFYSREEVINKKITTPNNAKYMRVAIKNGTNYTQVEENSEATSYEPYGKVWYNKANIGKIVLDGSNDEEWTSTGNNVFASKTGIVNAIKYQSYSNYYTYNPVETNVTGTLNNGEFALQYNSPTQNRLFFKNANILNVNDFKTWLETHNTIIYYVLATPTYTEITNTTLINQLETIKKSYEDKTYINVSGNLPMIINASALEKE